ncbi:hypothetical protein Asphe3_33960 [Pseudarthrobacter phenanthrenivorans Sphe3]|jgi:hypothetical protein|uniref:Uncharacterized protein n=1 Tax=Pseudarthrobacter phenanthrenivorans (strain DSM 18606 / JCM 16027 / LMG 23796 / Sphe3) TaxID=930171 RepID=F0M414_PSEPM|nr:hypothetical protein [Pseudarthrobacter phenanthrenivorans]ADX74501.1 hypothetical protein Asphe3_33960 [Pseudarthrobacter phenanthrenivorans Sphe3]
MGFDPNEPEQRRQLRAAMKAADISLSELWLKYFGLSGDAGEYEVEAYLQGLLSLPPMQRDLLALAANELIDDLPRPRAPYSDDFDGGTESGSDGSAASEDGSGRQADADE